MCLGTALCFQLEVSTLGNRAEQFSMLLFRSGEVVFRILANDQILISAERIFGLSDKDFGARRLNFQPESGLSINRDVIAFIPRALASDVRIGLNRRF